MSVVSHCRVFIAFTSYGGYWLSLGILYWPDSGCVLTAAVTHALYLRQSLVLVKHIFYQASRAATLLGSM
jgi:succinate-acetate transporter protein